MKEVLGKEAQTFRTSFVVLTMDHCLSRCKTTTIAHIKLKYYHPSLVSQPLSYTCDQLSIHTTVLLKLFSLEILLPFIAKRKKNPTRNDGYWVPSDTCCNKLNYEPHVPKYGTKNYNLHSTDLRLAKPLRTKIKKIRLDSKL